MVTKACAGLAALALSVAACGGGDSAQETVEEESSPATTQAVEPEPISLELLGEDGSTMGTATLTPEKVGSFERFEIALELEGVSVAHVHNVTCDAYKEIKGLDRQIATVISPLEDLRDGVSRSTAPGSITDGGLSINVHKPAPPFPVVACADIPEG